MLADIRVPKGRVHDNEIVAIFGDVVIEGTVTGEVVVILGSLQISGTVEGDVVSVLSRTTLAETAHVEGELVNVGWNLEHATGSRVDGQLVNVNFMSLVPFATEGEFWSFVFWLIFLIKLALLTVLFLGVLVVSAIAPRRVSLIAAAIPARWGWSILVGLLALALFVVTCCVLTFTIIGAPLAIALWFALQVTKWLGLAAIFYLVGQSIGRNLFRRELPHISCVLGGFVLFALLSLIPFFGLFLKLVLNVVAVGMVIVTRFGSEEPWGQGRVTVTGSAPREPTSTGAASPGT
jgi:hypothetical protein